MKKRFTGGTGRLDAHTLNQMAQAGYAHAEQAEGVGFDSLRGPYLAIINPPSGNAPQELEGTPAYKWAYDFVVVDPTYADKDGEYLWQANSAAWVSTGRSSSGDVSALNLCELNNSAATQMGVDTSNLPSGVELQPVPDVTHVMLWIAATPYNSGTPNADAIGEQGSVAFFTYPNQFDGEC